MTMDQTEKSLNINGTNVTLTGKKIRPENEKIRKKESVHQLSG